VTIVRTTIGLIGRITKSAIHTNTAWRTTTITAPDTAATAPTYSTSSTFALTKYRHRKNNHQRAKHRNVRPSLN
jgi:hypothetical protein